MPVGLVDLCTSSENLRQIPDANPALFIQIFHSVGSKSEVQLDEHARPENLS
jgi:hypothetical protein